MDHAPRTTAQSLPPRVPRRALALTLTLAAAACAPRPHVAPAPVPGAAAPAAADRSAAATLEARIRDRVEGFGGHVGVYARHLATGRQVAIDADALYPTASMIKVPLLVGLHDAVADGRLDLEARLAYDDSLFYASDADIPNKLTPGSEIGLGQLAVLMIVLSDNTSSLWIQGLVGGARVNEWLAGHGFEATRVNSRVDGRRGDWEVYGWGQSTPREMARLFVMIRDGEAVDSTASDAMYRLLSRSYWPHGATAVIPPSVNVAAKAGAVSAARSETLLVNAPAGDYVLSVMTREQEDTSWSTDNEGEALIRDISAMVYEAFGAPDT